MRPFVAGIDAGGTSVRLMLADAKTGEAVAEVKGAADPDGGPAPVAVLITQSGATAGQVQSACAGITKISRRGVADAWRAELTRLFPAAGEPHVVPDFVIAFHGAVPDGRGVGVVAGTGSVVYAEDGQGASTRVGGRGWEFGDEGSGAWLTAEAVRRTLRALDGVETPSPLTRAVSDALGTEDAARLGETARQRIETEGRGFLVPLLLAHARAGDREASDLFVGAAGWLGRQARAAHTRLGMDPTEPVAVATIGGLWEAGDLLLAPFREVVTRWLPRAQVVAPTAEPVAGAVRIALQDISPR